jgi:hypothetical protein
MQIAEGETKDILDEVRWLTTDDDDDDGLCSRILREVSIFNPKSRATHQVKSALQYSTVQ